MLKFIILLCIILIYFTMFALCKVSGSADKRTTKMLNTHQKKKKYHIGMYGGKFMPYHKGHLMCTLKAAEECEYLYLLMMYGGEQEEQILAEHAEDYLMPNIRFAKLVEAVKDYPNVIPKAIDVSQCRNEDGTESWEMETPLVRQICNKIDAVYGSEEEYRKYFEKEYPEAKYIIIDKDRKTMPISGTKVRNMSEEERKKWVV